MATDQDNSALMGLAERLKSTRTEKGLSQRALSQKIGVPQSHISKIENGQVDIKASSLIEIARALGLELALIPRALVPAVEALARSSQTAPVNPKTPTKFYGGGEAVKPAEIIEAESALENAAKYATRLSRALGPTPEINRLSEAVRDLSRWNLSLGLAQQVQEALKPLSSERIRDALKVSVNLNDIVKTGEITRALREAARAADSLRSIRNALAHGAAPLAAQRLPAYRLSDDGDENV